MCLCNTLTHCARYINWNQYCILRARSARHIQSNAAGITCLQLQAHCYTYEASAYTFSRVYRYSVFCSWRLSLVDLPPLIKDRYYVGCSINCNTPPPTPQTLTLEPPRVMKSDLAHEVSVIYITFWHSFGGFQSPQSRTSNVPISFDISFWRSLKDKTMAAKPMFIELSNI